MLVRRCTIFAGFAITPCVDLPALLAQTSRRVPLRLCSEPAHGREGDYWNAEWQLRQPSAASNWDPGEELLNVLRHFPLYDMPIPPSPSLNIFCILDIKSWLQRDSPRFMT
jgi:hypothetical protein